MFVLIVWLMLFLCINHNFYFQGIMNKVIFMHKTIKLKQSHNLALGILFNSKWSYISKTPFKTYNPHHTNWCHSKFLKQNISLPLSGFLFLYTFIIIKSIIISHPHNIIFAAKIVHKLVLAWHQIFANLIILTQLRLPSHSTSS